MKHFWKISLYIVIIFLLAGSCQQENNGTGPDNDNSKVENTYDVNANGIPKFIGTDYIEPDKISRISKFRSGIGHDYSDDFESCRSMKHYFQPGNSQSAINLYAPVSGTVMDLYEEWAGVQIKIKPQGYPAFLIILFHVNISDSIQTGDFIQEGQRLGTHIGSQTMSDIAIGVSTPEGWKLISYFYVITEAVFQHYQARGLTSRDNAVISLEDRNADPLTCEGEEFENSGNLENWINFQ